MGKMRLRHKIGLTFIDLMVIVIALIFVYFTVTPAEDMGMLTVDTTFIMFSVFITYVITVSVVEFFMLGMRQDTWFTKTAKSIVSSLLLMLLYPKALCFVLWLFGQRVAADVSTVLLWTMVFRTIIRIWLGRRWRTVDV